MKKITLLFAGILTACFLFAEEPATARINAYGLTMEKDGDNFTFNFNANIAATEASIVLFDKDGKTVSEQEITVAAGANEFTFTASELDLKAGDTLTWGVSLKAAAIKDFTTVYAETGGTNLQRKFLEIDRNPESPYFGRIYSEDRIASGNCHVTAYNADYSVLVENVTSIGNVGRPGVDEQGFVYCSDYGDGSAGVQVIDPADLTKSTQLFQGTLQASGMRTTSDGDGICGSTMCAEIYGSGAHTQLVVSNEDAGTGILQTMGCLVFNLGQADGSIVRSWDKVPSHQVKLTHNAGSAFTIRKTDKGMWWAQNRDLNQNTKDSRSLMFYNNADSLVFESTDQTLFNGSKGGGMDISRDGSTLAIVNGNGNIMIFDVEWDGEIPTLTHDTTYTSGATAVTSISFDYGGNLVCAAGTYGTNVRLKVWALPTEDNSVVVPAQKAQVVVSDEKPFEPVEGDNILWTINNPNASFGDITAANNKYRDLAYYNDQLIVLTNPLVEGFPRILKFNANTGAYVGNVSVKDVWGGDIALSSIQVLDNGEMVAMSCRVDPTSGKVKFYGWDNLNADPTLLGEVNLSFKARVEALYYDGDLEEGAFYCASESNQVAVIPVSEKTVDDADIYYISLDKYTMETAPRVLKVTEDEIAIACKGKFYGWTRTDATSTVIAQYAVLTSAAQEATNGVKFFEYKGEKHWAALNYANESATTLADPQIYVASYDSIGRWSAAGKEQLFLSDKTLLKTTSRNTSFASGIAVRVNKDGYNVWMCSLNQGIVAYQFVDKGPSTEIENVFEPSYNFENAPKTKKVMLNGQIYIIRDGHMFNMQGMLVK